MYVIQLARESKLMEKILLGVTASENPTWPDLRSNADAVMGSGRLPAWDAALPTSRRSFSHVQDYFSVRAQRK